MKNVVHDTKKFKLELKMNVGGDTRLTSKTFGNRRLVYKQEASVTDKGVDVEKNTECVCGKWGLYALRGLKAEQKRVLLNHHASMITIAVGNYSCRVLYENSRKKCNCRGGGNSWCSRWGWY